MNLTFLPPVAESHHSPHFDRHQFAWHRHLPNGGLDFKDIQRNMHSVRLANLTRGRRNETPAWATNNVELQKVLLKYLESRLYLPKAESLTHKQRLERIRQAAKERSKGLQQRLELWMGNVRALRDQRFADLSFDAYKRMIFHTLRGMPLERQIREAARQTQIVDGELYFLTRPAELCAAITYSYFRLGWNSTSIGEQFRLGAPAVRQILARMNRAAVGKRRRMRRAK